MDLEVFYDVSKAGYGHWWVLILAVVAIVSLPGLVRLLRNAPTRSWEAAPLCGVFCVGLFISALAVLSLVDYFSLSSALNAGRCEVVEGVVTNYHPMPPEQHTVESFVVAGRRIELSSGELNAGFNRTCLDGSPIREGKRVRLHLFEGRIARLEAAAPVAPRPGG